jgi:Mg2+ and Co2+ transporter CorA
LPNIALNWRSLALSSDNHLNGKFDQSASLLHRDYGKSLDKELMATDPFYALHELYSFSAHSTCQFLNLVDSIIMAETGYQSKHDHQFSHATLQYHQDILAQQSRVLRGTIRSIKRSSFWTELGLSVVTESLKPQKTTLVTCRTSLLADFEELLERTELLVNRCARGMGAIMNQAMLGESQRAISQAKKIEQLSFLATFYIPLSFTTSFFGMNLGVVGKGGLPLWLWFAISFPVLLLSYGSLQFLMYVNLKI